MPDSLVQALIAHFDSVFEGPNGDYPAVLEALAGLTVIQAAWKPAPDCNSIWQIVDHLTASKIWQIDMLKKGQAVPPVWTQPSGEESTWRVSVTQLKDAHTKLKVTLGQLSEEDLLTVPVPEWNQTRLELLLSSAAHEAYHGGQIDYLKGLQAETSRQ
jgi:uncharacterized damage-inducible protein DinB